MSGPRHYTVNPRRLLLVDPAISRDSDQTCDASNLGPNVLARPHIRIKYNILHEGLRCSHLKGTGADTCDNHGCYLEQNENTMRWDGPCHGVFQMPEWEGESRYLWFVEGLVGKKDGEAVKGKEGEDA